MSPHGVELPFVFDLAERTELAGSRPDRLELAAAMSSRWAAFARSGDPGPEWPAYDLADRPTMVFAAQSRIERDPYREERALLERALSAHPVP
jgi:para-nitrobenzyl esterase